MKKVIFKWSNGVTKEIEVNCNAAKIIAVAEMKMWCKENGFIFPKYEVI